jgi:pyruvate dehydrogenase E2 component (dihydrolipoamide acetyltransferase)
MVQGTGPGGRIVKTDVMTAEPSAKALPAPTEAPAAAPASVAVPAPKPVQVHVPTGTDEIVPLSRMRQQIARVTVGSKTTIPHFYVTADIDMTEAMALRKQINENLKDDGVRVSVNDLIIKACVNTLKKHPKFNAYFTDDGIQMHESINVGIAIAEEDGLIMPAILDCGHKSLAEITTASKDLVERSQSGTLHPQEYTGGTFSISNMGMFDVTSFVAIIQPPQSGVLAVGTVQKRPVVQDDTVVVRQMMSATLSVDHRVSDGAEGATFIVDLKNQLENPLKLLM